MASVDRGAAPAHVGPAWLDAQFVGVRAKVLEVAAFLDRAERYGMAADFRCVALRDVLPLLSDGQGERARRILEALSDPSTEPAPAAVGKGASGAWHARG